MYISCIHKLTLTFILRSCDMPIKLHKNTIMIKKTTDNKVININPLNAINLLVVKK